MIVTLIAAVFSGCTLALYRVGRSKAGYGPYVREADWPRALQALVKDDPSFRTNVTAYGLGDFIDHRSIWRLDRDSPLLDHMLSNINLEPTDVGHPKSSELIGNVPYGWPSFDWTKCTWYATPGYGAQHIEGVDLYLIAVDEKSGCAVALHEWLF
tara:strand:- start:55 stop:519 length:465 start_codon:yes stop_codon:yes gene_type:complete